MVLFKNGFLEKGIPGKNGEGTSRDLVVWKFALSKTRGLKSPVSFNSKNEISTGTFPILSRDPSCQETIKDPGATPGF